MEPLNLITVFLILCTLVSVIISITLVVTVHKLEGIVREYEDKLLELCNK